MNLATLTERIREAITTGSMPAQLSLGYAAVDFTIGDLLRPWGKLYPGVPEALASAETPQPFDYRSPLRRPTLNPSPRRSPRMLQPPRRIPASPRMIQKSLLSSMSGIWDYYKHHGLADRRILRNMLTAESLEQFLDPLQNIASNYSPMEMDLENINYSDIIGLTGFNLFIPCETYEDEGAGVIQGFLEGVSGVRWLLENYFESSENGEDLPKQDKKLIAEVGFEAILTAYAAAPSPKMADLEKLGDFSKTYFGQVEKDYPEHYSTDFDIISGDGGSNNSLTITSRQDIEFALAYAEAYFDMMGDIPTPWQFTENHEGVFDTFVHEICEAWRKANGKRAVKWTSPQQKTLAVRFRTGDL